MPPRLAMLDDRQAKRIACVMRLLTSNQPGEAQAALQALGRLLLQAGASIINDVAERIEKSTGLSDAEMKKLYTAGYEEGVRAVEAKQVFDEDGFTDAMRLPSSHEIARWCQQRSERLSERQRKFVDEVAASSLWKEPTERQRKWLLSIFCD